MTQQPPGGWQPPQGQPEPQYGSSPQPPLAAAKKKPWYTRWWVIAIVALVAIGIIVNLVGGDEETAAPAPTAAVTPVDDVTTAPAETEAGTPDEAVEPTPEATAEEVDADMGGDDDVSSEFRAALTSAENYLSFMSFCEAGLFDQLTSEYGDGFPEDAAQYAVDNVEVDWDEQALQLAIQYRETMSMSDNAIWDQLTSDYGERCTDEQADYAIANLPD